MVNTCPNCSHPLRPGAKFCGFCGTDLTKSVGKPFVGSPENSIASLDAENYNTRRKDPFRTISIIAIFVLILIILAAVAWQNWAYILPYVSQLLPGLFVK